MTVAKMLLNKKSWVEESEYVKNYIGKKLTKTLSDVPVYYQPTNHYNGKPDDTQNIGPDNPVKKQILSNNDIWLELSVLGGSYYVKVSDLAKMGGYSRSYKPLSGVLSPVFKKGAKVC